jgi:signal transduction histidine kinase
VELETSGPTFPLPPSAQLAVYRMAQEALTNTLKHAPGAAAQVKLRYRPGGVELEVIDDGPPVVPDGRTGRTGKSGHGIAGMRERAAVFGGDVSAGPRPGGGWRVHTVLHLGPAGTAAEDLAGTEELAGTEGR